MNRHNRHQLRSLSSDQLFNLYERLYQEAERSRELGGPLAKSDAATWEEIADAIDNRNMELAASILMYADTAIRDPFTQEEYDYIMSFY